MWYLALKAEMHIHILSWLRKIYLSFEFTQLSPCVNSTSGDLELDRWLGETSSPDSPGEITECLIFNLILYKVHLDVWTKRKKNFYTIFFKQAGESWSQMLDICNKWEKI